MKFNESLAQNKNLRERIDTLRRERVVFDSIYKKLERELHEKKKASAGRGADAAGEEPSFHDGVWFPSSYFALRNIDIAQLSAASVPTQPIRRMGRTYHATDPCNEAAQR